MRRAGAAVALGTVLALAAVTFDTPSLYVPGVALSALAAGSALWVWLASQGAGIVRRSGPPTVQEEAPYPLRLELLAGLLPPPGGAIRDPLLADPVPVGPLAPRRLRIEVRFARRGRRVLEPATLVLCDPLRLAVRELPAGGGAEELLVLPRIEPVLYPGAGGGAGSAGVDREGTGGRESLRGRMDGSAAELDLEGLRPYRQGTPASRIHWPALARSGEMLERRLSTDADSAPLVVLDASAPPSEQALDMAVRAAASLCVHLGRRGGCALLLPGDRRTTALAPDMSGWPALHARLALAGPARVRPPLERARRAGSVLWVSARGDAPRELARAARGGGWLVTPTPGAEGRAAFTVSGCTGYRLGRGALDPRTTSARAAGRAG